MFILSVLPIFWSGSVIMFVFFWIWLLSLIIRLCRGV